MRSFCSVADVTLRDLVTFAEEILYDVGNEVLITEPFTDEEILADFRERQVEQDSSGNNKNTKTFSIAFIVTYKQI